jgi:ligand-binding SRPBCC domain-containing protein
MPYRLSCSLWLPLNIEESFRFFEDAKNLPRITPEWLGFVILTQDIQMHAGTLIDYKVHWGVPMKWRTLIEAYEPPVRFVDRQLKGPYRLWHHEHTFREADGGTLVNDAVTYLPPFGPLGWLAQSLMIRRNLRQIFEYRQQRIAELLLGARAPEAQIRQPVRFEWLRGEPVPLKAP